MSRRKQKRRAEEDGSKSSHALYVYCVGGGDALRRLFEERLPAAIEPVAKLDLVVGDHLAAVVSEVSLADYGEESLAASLADPTWTAVRAMRHEQVVEHFSSRAAVVPLRFGAIYFARNGVEQMLAERAAELQAIVRGLEGRQEWGISVACDKDALAKVIDSLSPRLRELAERARAAQPGQSYLLRKKIDALRADEARLEIKRVVSEIEQALARRSERSTSLRVLKDEATEHGKIVGKLAFLVASKRFDDFHKEAERLARAHADSGFKLEMTGPWPAYNFSTGED
ncbi:MAG TPA: GvpL/GvpF family gas vesicle protein [Blastocatellia bacterium]|nr:GvpL/GvpF family gas vesicle protein [Blastocatellia bacterium]